MEDGSDCLLIAGLLEFEGGGRQHQGEGAIKPLVDELVVQLSVKLV